MQVLNEMTLRFPSKSQNEAFARAAVAAFALQLDPTIQELADIKTIVSEAVTNAIIHGYENNEGEITVQARVLENRGIEITVRDEGVGIDNIEAAMQPMYTSKPHLERSGMGFTIIQQFADSLEVCSEPGKGTTVRMQVWLSRPERK